MTRAAAAGARTQDDSVHIPRDILDFAENQHYLGLTLSVAQRVLLKAIYGLPLDGKDGLGRAVSTEDDEWAVFAACTGRTAYTPGTPVEQVTVIAGRRSGKDSRIAAPIALYEALYTAVTSDTGEPIVVPLVAMNERGARIAFKYIAGYANRRPRISRWVHDERTTKLVVENAVTGAEIEIMCFACKAASLRGWSIPAIVMDEVAFFSIEAGLEKDEEVQTAAEGAGIHFARQIIVKISSPAAKRGLLFTDSEAYWGVNDAEVLVWKADSRTMNPAINQERIDRARRRNPDAARSEYDAEFRADLETFLPRELLELATMPGRRELAPVADVRYVVGIDPTGGTGTDAFTLAIVHLEWRDRPVIVQDVMRGWRRSKKAALNLKATVAEIAALCARYGVHTGTGDAYAGDWPAQEFRDTGFTYEKAEVDKAGAFLELQPWLARGDIELLDQADLKHEASLLEKRNTLRGKKPAIGHPKGGHDDYPNALALAVAKLAGTRHGAVAVPVAAGRAPVDGADPHAAADQRFWGGARTRFWNGMRAQAAAQN